MSVGAETVPSAHCTGKGFNSYVPLRISGNACPARAPLFRSALQRFNCIADQSDDHDGTFAFSGMPHRRHAGGHFR